MKNIVLFRATKVNPNYKTEFEKKFYKYYVGTECNNLDIVIDRKFFKMINMEQDDHLSWIHNEEQTTALSNFVLSLFKLKGISLKNII